MNPSPQATGVDLLVEALLALAPGERTARLEAEQDPAAALEAIAQRGADLAIGQTARGEQIARLAVDESDALGGDSLRARTRVALAHVLNYANRFEEAMEVLGVASSLASAAGDRFAAARASLISMHALARLGRMDEALAAGDDAIAGFAALGERVWRAKADVNVGVIRRMRDDPAGALLHFDAARGAFAEAPPILAQIESNRAEALLDLGRFAEAEAAFRAALAAFQQAGIARAAAIAEGNLADLLGRQGRFESALDHFERARRTLEGLDAPADLARLRAEEADALATLGMLPESAAAYGQALGALDTAGLPAEAARARVGLARVLSRFGRAEEAGAELARAIDAFEAIPNPTGAARAGIRLAQVRLTQGRLGDAAALLDRFEPVLASRPVEGLSAVAARAALLIASRDHAGAVQLLTPAIQRARDAGLRPLLVDLLDLRGAARRQAGDGAGAIADFRAAIDVAEQIRSLLQADRLRSAAMGERSDLYAQCVDALLERAASSQVDPAQAAGDRALAFEVADRAKARSLLDLLQGGHELAEQLAAADNRHADAPEAGMLRELSDRRAEMNAIYAALFAPHDRRLGDQTQQRLAARLDEHEAHVAEIERRLASARRLSHLGATVVSLEQVRRALRPGEALLEYFGAAGSLGAAVVTRDRLHIERHLGSMADLADLGERLSMAIDRQVIDRARGPLRTPVVQAASHAGRSLKRLHQLALAPLEAAFQSVESLIVVPHGPLHAMPLHAALGPTGHLVERLAVAYAPSAAYLVHARGMPRAEPGTPARLTGHAVVVGVPDQIAPEMGQEAEAVAQVIPDARLLVGEQATFEAFAEASRGAAHIHLACHGVFASRNPMQARLRFSDRWVTVRDLVPLALSGCVVVLSGCDTGRAGVDRGDEAYGLGRALLVAGASATILSLWPVHDRTTRDLMISMYQGLFPGYLSGSRSGGGGAGTPGPGQGPGVGHALARAQRELLRQGEDVAVWAPFMLVGDPRP